MRISAVSVKTKDMKRSIKFYKILGFKFKNNISQEQHVENIHTESDIKLMIDTKEMIKSVIGCEPKVSNFSTFAILYNTATEVDDVYQNLKASKFEVEKEPWDAFWGQRYCVVKDPDGHLIDLYAYLK